MLVRDRIKHIIDPGTEFIEIGGLAGFDMDYGDVPAGGIVTGNNGNRCGKNILSASYDFFRCFCL